MRRVCVDAGSRDTQNTTGKVRQQQRHTCARHSRAFPLDVGECVARGAWRIIKQRVVQANFLSVLWQVLMTIVLKLALDVLAGIFLFLTDTL